MNENTNHRFRARDVQAEQAPSSLMPALLARLELDKPEQAIVTSLAALEAALDDPSWTVRANAVQQLAQLEDPESVQLLLEALSDEDSSVRASAARVLGVRGHPEACDVCEQLEAALHDPDWHVRETVVYALGMLADPASLIALREVLNDPDDAVRHAAQLVIERLQQETHSAKQGEAQTTPVLPLQAIPAAEASFQRLYRSALRLLPRFHAGAEGNLDMSEEIEEVVAIENAPEANEEETEIKKAASTRQARPRRTLIRTLEQALAAVLVLAIILGWLAISHLPRSSSGSRLPFSDANAPSLGAPIATIQGDFANEEEWAPDGHTFMSLQINPQNNTPEVHMLNVVTGHTTVYPVLDSSWIPAINLQDCCSILMGRYLLGERAQGKNQAVIEIWDIIAQRAVIIRTVPAPISPGGQVEAPWIATSNNEQKLAVFAADGTVSIWDVASGQILTTCKGKVLYNVNDFPPPDIKWYNHDQSLLFSRPAIRESGTGNGQVVSWDTTTGTRLFTLGETGKRYEPSISPDGDYLAVPIGSLPSNGALFRADTLEILDAHSGQVLRSYHLTGPSETEASYSWLPDSQRLLVQDTSSNYSSLPASIWNVFTDQKTFVTSLSQNSFLSSTPNGQYLILVAGPYGQSEEIWQTNGIRKVATLETPVASRYTFSATNNQYILVGAQDHFDIWSVTTGELLYKYYGLTPYAAYNQTAGNVFWSPDGKYLALFAEKAASPISEGLVMIWRMP